MLITDNLSQTIAERFEARPAPLRSVVETLSTLGWWRWSRTEPETNPEFDSFGWTPRSFDEPEIVVRLLRHLSKSSLSSITIGDDPLRHIAEAVIG